MNAEDWKMLFQGAESKVRYGVYNGKEAVWKERFPKEYRHPELDRRLAKERTRAEVRNMEKMRNKCLELGSSTPEKKKCPGSSTPEMREKCLELGSSIPEILFSDDRNIVMTRVPNSITSCRFIQESVKNETNIDWLFTAIGRVVGLIHRVGVVHGDLTTSNFLVTDRQNVVPVDFGLSTHSTSSEDRAVDLYVLERALQTTHVSDDKFQLILHEYNKTVPSPENEKSLKKLEEVRTRGRKRLMIG